MEITTSLSILLTLNVLLLGWLHLRTNAVAREGRESVVQIREEIRRDYALRSEVTELSKRVSELVNRLDMLLRLMAEGRDR